MNFKVGDEVVVIAGSDKGKKGKIIIQYNSNDDLERILELLK